MENFEFEKSSYLNELKNVLFTEELSVYEYAKELGEENVELIRNPKNFGELNLVKRALEIFMKLKEVSKTEEFDPENNSTYVISCFTAKGIRRPEYFDYAAELASEITGSEYLRGKFIVDSMCLPEGVLNNTFNYEMEQSEDPFGFMIGMVAAPSIVAIKASMICREKGIEEPGTQDEIAKGVPSYIHLNECIYTYLSEREKNPKDDFIMNFRIKRNI